MIYNMDYRSERKKRKGIRWGSTIGTGFIVILLFVLFIFAVSWFRKPKDNTQERIDSIADVLTPDPISQAVLNGAIDTESREAVLRLASSSADVGTAKRGTKDKKYFFEIKSSLPEIDREVFFYEVWLLRQVPYTYFSVGEMITDDDGYFVIEWGAEDDTTYQDYTDIIITRQEYGGSTDPQTHIVTGSFGK